MKVITLVSVSTLFLMSCSKQDQHTFALESSPIRYQTQAFEDASILAKVSAKSGDLTLTQSQILAKSVVFQDLEAQIEDAKIGLVIRHAIKQGGEKLEFVSLQSESPIEKILLPFALQAPENLKITFPKSRAHSGVLAKLDGKDITEKDVSFAHFRVQVLESRRFAEIASQLNSQLSRMLLNNEAEKTKTPIQDYIDKEVLKGQKPQASEDEIKQYAKQIGLSEQELDKNLKTRFNELLSSQKTQALIEKHVAEKLLSGPVRVSFSEPKVSIEVSRNWKPVNGYADAPVSIVAFSGTTCPDCVPFAKGLLDAIKENDGYLKVNWIHFFDPNDGLSQMIAETALCAEGLRKGSMIRFIESVSQSGAELNEASFYKWAQAQGLDDGTLQKCVVDRGMKSLAEDHLKYAEAVGVVANPTVWIEGQAIEGSIKPDKLNEMIRAKIVESGATGLGAWWRRTKSKLGINSLDL